MRAHTPGRYAALALLLGGLACAGNKNNDDGTVVAQDSTQANDTSAYVGPQRDTTGMADTTRAVPDTSNYAPAAPTDTSAAAPAAPTDTSSYAPAAPTAPTDTNSSSGMERSDTLNGNQQSASPDSGASSSGWSSDSSAGMSHDSTGTSK